jgi:hypothetical protein
LAMPEKACGIPAFRLIDARVGIASVPPLGGMRAAGEAALAARRDGGAGHQVPLERATGARPCHTADVESQ